MSQLHYENSAGVASLVLGNPPDNRLTPQTFVSLKDIVDDLLTRDDTRVVVLSAIGKDFCLGGDFTGWLDFNETTAQSAVAFSTEIVNAFEDLPLPIVAAVQGHCRGGGFELALRADVIIAAQDARFGHPEAGIGIFTLLGGVQRVAERVGRARAMRWALSTEMIDASEAYATGLVSEVVPVDELGSKTDEIVARLAGGPTLAHADHKKLLRAWSDHGVRAADALLPGMAARTFLSKDARGSLRVAIDAYKEGRPRPAYGFEGC